MRATQLAVSNSDLDLRAEVLAKIQLTHQELETAHDEIDRLTVALNRAEDRVELLNEERNRFRAEALIFRSRLIELATAMSNIGLLCRSAEEIVRTVNELNNATSPTAEAMERLEREFGTGNPT